MNKGLFAHIISTIIYVILVLFIYNGESVNKDGRIGIVFGFVIVQWIILFFGSFEGWYKEKI